MPDQLADEACRPSTTAIDDGVFDAPGQSRPPVADDTADDATADQARSEAYRRRLLEGMAASIEERGLIDTTVADIVRHARTSRRTFYEHFTDRAACFQALVKEQSDLALQVTLATVDRGAAVGDQIRTGLAAACASFADKPALTISAVRDLPSLGSSARAMQRQMLDDATETLLSIVDHGRPVDGNTVDASRTLARMAIGGIREIIVSTLEDGADLPGKCDEIADGILRLMTPPA